MVVDSESGDESEIAVLPSAVGPLRWDAAGDRLVLLCAATAGAPDDSAPHVVDGPGWRRDGQGLRRDDGRAVVVLDVATATLRRLSPSGWDATSAAWRSDGGEVAFTAIDPNGPPGTSRAYVVPSVRDQPRAISSADGHARAICWPPGSGPVWVGRQARSVGIDTLLVTTSDGDVLDLLAGQDFNVVTGGPGYPGGVPVPGRARATVLAAVRDEGGSRLLVCPTDQQGPVEHLGGDAATAHLLAFDALPADDGAVVCVSSPESCGELEFWSARTTSRLTALHERIPARPLHSERRGFTISDGTRVSGWVLRDPSAPTPAPLLVDIHGGPHNAWSPALSTASPHHQVLASAGWTVLLLDPRGSDGYGSAHLTANLGSWGHGDACDILDPTAELIRNGEVDPSRAVVTGYSYGGFLTCWLSTVSHPFSAAIVGGCVSDGASMLTSMSATELYDDMLATPWHDLFELDSQSPLRRVGEVRVPTLVLHGAADAVCPPQQAEQWFSALLMQGVRTEMVLYPGAGHGFLHDGRPSHVKDYAARLIRWSEEHTGR